MFIKVPRSNIVADDQGYMIIADPNGIMLTLRTPQKCIRRWMTISELYFYLRNVKEILLTKLLLRSLNNYTINSLRRYNV